MSILLYRSNEMLFNTRIKTWYWLFLCM